MGASQRWVLLQRRHVGGVATPPPCVHGRVPAHCSRPQSQRWRRRGRCASRELRATPSEASSCARSILCRADEGALAAGSTNRAQRRRERAPAPREQVRRPRLAPADRLLSTPAIRCSLTLGATRLRQASGAPVQWRHDVTRRVPACPACTRPSCERAATRAEHVFPPGAWCPASPWATSARSTRRATTQARARGTTRSRARGRPRSKCGRRAGSLASRRPPRSCTHVAIPQRADVLQRDEAQGVESA